MNTKLSPMKAIHAFCKTCIYDPGGGNGSWLNQVEGCTSPTCPLFEHRPLTLETKARLRDERFNALDEAGKAKYRAKQEIARQRMTKTLSSEKTINSSQENSEVFL